MAEHATTTPVHEFHPVPLASVREFVGNAADLAAMYWAYAHAIDSMAAVLNEPRCETANVRKVIDDEVSALDNKASALVARLQAWPALTENERDAVADVVIDWLRRVGEPLDGMLAAIIAVKMIPGRPSARH